MAEKSQAPTHGAAQAGPSVPPYYNYQQPYPVAYPYYQMNPYAQQMPYWGTPVMMPPPFMYAAPPPAPPYTSKPKRVPNRKPTLATTMNVTDLVVLGLVAKPLDVDPPAYPSHLPFVRCCYDSNEKKGCEKGCKCYHIHKDPSHRTKPDQPIVPGRNHEVYVDRPHFVAFDNSEDANIDSLPCHYGIHCKDPDHRERAECNKYTADGMRNYEVFLRNYRNYEFELIKYQLSVNKARRELTDEVVVEAFSKLGSRSSELSREAFTSCEAVLSKQVVDPSHELMTKAEEEVSKLVEELNQD